ncbi:MAG: DNA methyltransferase, partial [Aggregatilineales bacterium]
MSLDVNQIYHGDARDLLLQIDPESIALSVWSPPYFLGKDYEKYLSFESWQQLLCDVIRLHFDILKPGAFVVINIADILAFPDEDMPRIQAENIAKRRSSVTRDDVLKAMLEYPDYNRY